MFSAEMFVHFAQNRVNTKCLAEKCNVYCKAVLADSVGC